jgi:hypothetical protein
MRFQIWYVVLAVLSVGGCLGAREPKRDPASVVSSQQALTAATACPAGSNIIVGTPGDDVLAGTNGADCILGGDGNDRIDGGNGDDVLIGGNGDDVIVGGNGNDTLDGGNGDDQLNGGSGNDTLIGGAGNDILVGDNGDDVIQGGSGNDVLSGANGNDTLSGDDGDDVIDNGRGTDSVDGGAGFDLCAGSSCERSAIAVQTGCHVDSDCVNGFRCSTAGVCLACRGDAECDDGNVCTTDSCQPAVGCRRPAVPNGTLCLDSTVCNGQETCQSGTCAHGVPLSCDDGSSCDGQETCDAVLGCQAGTPPACGAHSTCVDLQGSYYCPCDEQYEVVGSACVLWCTPIVVGAGVHRCVRVRDGGQTVTLHLSPDVRANENHNQIDDSGTLLDAIPWFGQYTADDEHPYVSYCGPTAGKNLLYWYGSDTGLGSPSYATIGAEMNTDNWDGGLVFWSAFGACSGEPTCTGIVDAALSSALNNVGTLPDDFQNAVTMRMPSGYVPRGPATFSGSLDEIRASLTNGNPIAYLESKGSLTLHWAIIIGVDAGAGHEGDPLILVANSDARPWSTFQADRSLVKVGDSFIRGVVGAVGLHPNTMYRWDQLPTHGTTGTGGPQCSDSCCGACAACSGKTPNPGACDVCDSCRVDCSC